MTIAKNLKATFLLEGKEIMLTGTVGGIGSVLAKGLAAGALWFYYANY